MSGAVTVMQYQNQQWIYQQRPTGRVGPEHYRLDITPMEAIVSNNEVIVEMKFISVDPYMRIAQAERDNWEEPHPLNTLQGAGTIGQIIVTAHPGFAVGDWVLGYLGWQKYGRCHGNSLTKLDPTIPVTTSLGVLGMPGRTAWFGLMEAGRPRFHCFTCLRLTLDLSLFLPLCHTHYLISLLLSQTR
jgi:NADPH-dependent curcumin reductase CurA